MYSIITSEVFAFLPAHWRLKPENSSQFTMQYNTIQRGHRHPHKKDVVHVELSVFDFTSNWYFSVSTILYSYQGKKPVWMWHT